MTPCYFQRQLVGLPGHEMMGYTTEHRETALVVRFLRQRATASKNYGGGDTERDRH